MSFPTPEYDLKKFESVYEPAEDTFLFLDALQIELERINQGNPAISLEIGSGSGVVSSFLSQILKSKGTELASFATDLNPSAANCTKLTAQLNTIPNLFPVITDLTGGLIPQLSGKVDILLFNPPYVPTSEEELKNSIKLATVSGITHQDKDTVLRDNLIINSWAGGKNGREITNRFLPLVPELLSSSGVFYLVAVEENNISDLLEYYPDFKGDIVIQRRSGPEQLYILRYIRKK